MSDTPKNKGCPFCGKLPTWGVKSKVNAVNGNKYHVWRIYCSCRCVYIERTSKERMFDAWNRRIDE